MVKLLVSAKPHWERLHLLWCSAFGMSLVSGILNNFDTILKGKIFLYTKNMVRVDTNFGVFFSIM